MADYDVIVLGGGTAGTAAARSARLAGAGAAVVHDGEMGGLCILRGCMPTKAMLASAHAVHEARNTAAMGVRLEGEVVPEFSRIMERKNEQVARFKRAKVASIESHDYDWIEGRASFGQDGRLEVDGTSLEAGAYIVATGSVPAVPPIPGIEDVPYWTSDDVMRLESPPSSLTVYGTGAVGLELAQFFARIGTDVRVVGRSPLLHAFDTDAGQELVAALESEPRLTLDVPGRIAGVRRRGDGVAVRIESGDSAQEHISDALLVATGRRAALDDLGLEHVGIDVSRGRLEHDRFMRTSNPRVYAAGDATGAYQILHLANQEGTVAGHNAAGVEPLAVMDYRLKMSVIFTDPPFAHVGLTAPEVEEERNRGREILESRIAFPETGRAITMNVEHGLWKLWVDRETCEVLGSAILGPRADDLIHLISLIMFYRGRVPDLAHLPWYHPTLSEVMLNLARDAAGRVPGCERPAASPA